MFSTIVEMYRGLGRPEIVEGVFTFSGKITSAVKQTIEQSVDLPVHFGNFEHYSLVGTDFECEFCLPSSEIGRFHKSISEFITHTPSLNFGDLPKEFYIQDIDFYSGDTTIAPKEISHLADICRLIKGLSALASTVNSTDATRGTENKLLFVLAADGKTPAKTLVLPIKINPDDVKHALTHIKLIELLVSDKTKNEIHVEERRSIMRLAIAEVIALPDDPEHSFSYLIRQWKLVLEKYRHNVLAFVNQYAFEKVRKEIATAEVDHATKLSGVLGDIAGKLLALPVSFAAVTLLRKASTPEEFWILFLGLFAVSIIFGGVLWNQWLQIKRLRSSFDFIFGQYDEDAFPKKLRTPIASAKKNIGHQYDVLKITFIVFSVLAALPTLGAIYVAVSPNFCSLIDTYLMLFTNKVGSSPIL